MRQPPDMALPCRGLAIGTPCPTPDDCVCSMVRDEGVRLERLWRNVLLLMVVIISLTIATVIVIFTVSAARSADVDPACLTYSQAKAKWPKGYLRWRGEHCWYLPGRKTDRLPLYRPKQEPDGALVQKVIVAQGPVVAYPDLMPGGGTDSAMLRAEAMTVWPLVVDFDTDPPVFAPWRERVTPMGHQ